MSTTTAAPKLKWTTDERIIKSIRNAFGHLPERPPLLIPQDRRECVRIAATADAVQAQKLTDELFGSNPMFAGGEAMHSSQGFEMIETSLTSAPDGNNIAISIVRQKKEEEQKEKNIVIYLHGGGMAKASCFHGNFQTFARMIASHEVIVVLVDFRNSITPARPGDDISAYPGGLNDCISAVRWVFANRTFVGGGSTSRIVLAGESGGGNLSIATALKLKDSNELSFVDGIYAMCPFISGKYPNKKYPSTKKYDGFVLTSASMQTFVVGYGDDCRHDKFAWPSHCTIEDVRGLCPIVVSMNEFDPLLDEGMDFYRKCSAAGVDARGLVLSGSTHGCDNYFPGTAPRLARATACAVASFAKGEESGSKSKI